MQKVDISKEEKEEIKKHSKDHPSPSVGDLINLK